MKYKKTTPMFFVGHKSLSMANILLQVVKIKNVLSGNIILVNKYISFAHIEVGQEKVHLLEICSTLFQVQIKAFK